MSGSVSLAGALAADDAIAALHRYSLVAPAGDGLVSVHRLVQAVTIDQMAGDLLAQWRQAAAAVIEAAIPASTDASQTWPVFALLLPHAQAALADSLVPPRADPRDHDARRCRPSTPQTGRSG